jgi:tetratricopeptide (TPR) repeat protein
MLHRPRRPLWQPSRLSRLSLFLKRTLKQVTFRRTAIALPTLLLVWLLIKDVRKEVIIIEPLLVPKQMEDEGYTGAVIARQIADEINRMQGENGQRKEALGSMEEPTINFEAVGTKFSFNAIVRLLQSLVDTLPPQVSGEITMVPKNHVYPQSTEVLQITFRIQPDTLTTAQQFEVPIGRPSDVITETSRRILRATNAYVFGIYCVYSNCLSEAESVAKGLARAVDPKRKAQGYLLWSIVRSHEGQLDDAIEKIAKSANFNPQSSAFVYWGSFLYEKREYAGAIDKYQHAADLGYQMSSLYHLWAMALKEQGEKREAARMYALALKSDPVDLVACKDWAELLLEDGEYAAAITKYEDAAQIDPSKEDEIRNEISLVYSKWTGSLIEEGKYQQAVVIETSAPYVKRTDAQRRLAQIYLEWSLSLDRGGNTNEAILRCNHAAEMDVRNVRTRELCADLLEKAGRLREAIEAHSLAIEINPRFAPAYTGLGGALERQGKTTEATSLYRKAIKVQESDLSNFDPAPYDALAALLRRQGNVVGAHELLVRAVKIEKAKLLASIE